MFALILGGVLLWNGEAFGQPATDPSDAQYSISILKDLEDIFVDIAQKVMPAVVNVETEQTIDLSQDEKFRELHNLPPDILRMFNIRKVPTEGKGSGFIVDPNGIILTNHHVIAGADKVFVQLSSTMKYAAECFSDEHSEVAVLRINTTEPLPFIKLGDSEGVQVGQFAIAVGNPLGYDRTFSIGHITGKGRILDRFRDPVFYQNFLQTDANINRGNSGGPLINLDGEVIGINTAIVENATGMGFAIPIDIAKPRMDQLLTEGRVRYGFLGVEPKDIDLAVATAVYNLPDNHAVYIENIVPDSPAEKAGLQIRDIVLEVNGQSVEGANDLIQKVGAIRPGTRTSLKILRDKAEEELSLVVGERKDASMSITLDRQDNAWGMKVEPADPDLLRELGIDETGGVRVTEVEFGTPAFRAGVRKDDIVYRINDQNVPNERTLRRLQRTAAPGDFIVIEAYRETNPPWSSRTPWSHQTFWLKVGE